MAEQTDGEQKSTGSAIWRILRVISTNRHMSVTEIAAEVGLHKSSVSRALNNLRAEGMVAWDEQTQRYRLGLGMITLAGVALADRDLVGLARPILEALAEDTQESTALMAWDGHRAICVSQVSSPQPVKHSCALGESFDSDFSASVQVFRAWADDAQNAGRWREVRERGWSLNDGATSEQETSLAAPIWDAAGLSGALLVSAPSYRTGPERIVELGQLLTSSAADITRLTGGIPRHR